MGHPHWQKGQSGNPGGRPKVNRTLQELAREHMPDTVAKLVALRDDPEAPHSVQLGAANALLDRGFGRPVQSHNVRKVRSFEDLDDEELRALALSLDDGESEGATLQ